MKYALSALMVFSIFSINKSWSIRSILRLVVSLLLVFVTFFGAIAKASESDVLEATSIVPTDQKCVRELTDQPQLERRPKAFQGSIAEIEITRAIETRDKLIAQMRSHGAGYFRSMAIHTLINHLVILVKGWAQAQSAQLTAEEVLALARHFGLELPQQTNSIGLEFWSDFQTNYRGARNRFLTTKLFHHEINLLDVLSKEIVRRPLSWDERVVLFKKYLQDDPGDGAKYNTMYVLDSILGLDSLSVSLDERKQTRGLELYDDPANGQRTGLGSRPMKMWSDYRELVAAVAMIRP